MAVRNESVRVSLHDAGFTSGMARMAAAAKLFDQTLDSIDGNNVSVSRSLRATSREVDNLGGAFRGGGADIDRYSGRLRLFADAAVTLGPALIPIGAVAVPALTGLAAQFGFAAVGASTALVAFQGVGDALEAVNKAQLEPTAANLEAARMAMEQIGPHARTFVRELNSMDAAFTAIRDAGAAGLFPGMTRALQEIEPALPRVADLFEKVGTAIGDLVADGAESLAGPQWAEFIAFIGNEAPRALSEMGRTLGDVAHGMAELWMAFTPLNQNFTGWLRDSARAFDEWATGLSQTDGFQEFVEYVRSNGPKVAEAMGAIGNALVQVVQAAAPLGGPVLQVITQLADALANLADSDIGTPLFATAAGLAAISRAGKLLGVTSTGVAGLVGSLRQLALVGAFAGAVKGIQSLDDALQSLFDRDIDSSKLPESIEALASGRVPDDLEKMTGHLKNLDAGFLQLQDSAVGWLPGSTAVEEATEEIGKLDEQLAHLVDSGQGDAAAKAFATIESEAKKAGISTESVREAFSQYLAAVDAAKPRGAGLAEFFQEGSAAAEEMAGSVQSLSDALAGLSGWLDKREALAGFKDAMKALNDSINNGQVGQWASNVDSVGRSIVQVASTLRGGARFKFLDDAVSGLREMAQGAGPKAQAEIQALIGQLRKLDGTKAEPPIGAKDNEFKAKVSASERRMRALNALQAHPHLDLDDKSFQKTFGLTKGDLSFLNAYLATPRVNVDPGNSIGTLTNIRGLIAGINDKTVRITTIHQTVGRRTQGGLTSDTGTSADGGTVPKTGLPYADRHPYLLADGEEVISNRHGQADRHRALLKAINAGHLADGGTAGRANSLGLVFADGLGAPARDAARGLRALNKALAASEKAVSRERKQRDAILTRQDEIRSGIENSFLNDPFGNVGKHVWSAFGGGDLLGTLQGDISGLRQFDSLLKQLGGKGKRGIDGSAFEFLAQSGNVAGLQALSAMSPAEREQWERLFERRESLVRQVGNRAADQALGAALARESRQLEDVKKELRRIKQAINAESKKDRDNRDKNTKEQVRSTFKPAGNARKRARK